jgi:hypothetical protein
MSDGSWAHDPEERQVPWFDDPAALADLRWSQLVQRLSAEEVVVPAMNQKSYRLLVRELARRARRTVTALQS